MLPVLGDSLGRPGFQDTNGAEITGYPIAKKKKKKKKKRQTKGHIEESLKAM